MMPYRLPLSFVAASALAITLSACGGGGGGLATISPPPSPTPTPRPTPTPTPAIPDGANTSLNIIANAPTGIFALAGVNAPNWGESNPNVTLSPDDQPQMRYDAASDTYQIQFPARSWQTLWTKDGSLPDWARQVGIGDGTEATSIAFNMDRMPNSADAYAYSTLAGYSYPVNGIGYMAFGVPTPADAVPTSGSANYDGIIRGVSDIYGPGFGPDPWPTLLSISGTVTLSFDFAAGTLGGSMEAILDGESLGTFTFNNTDYSAGSYSGQFNSGASGRNGFYGHLTGPNGEELIGAWTLPFHYSGDGQDHQAIGAWIAKRP